MPASSLTGAGAGLTGYRYDRWPSGSISELTANYRDTSTGCRRRTEATKVTQAWPWHPHECLRGLSHQADYVRFITQCVGQGGRLQLTRPATVQPPSGGPEAAPKAWFKLRIWVCVCETLQNLAEAWPGTSKMNILPLAGPFGQLANAFFLFAGLFGDILLIRCAALMAYVENAAR